MSRTNTPSPAPLPRSASPALQPPTSAAPAPKQFRQSLGPTPSPLPTPSTAPTSHRQTMGPSARPPASGDRLALARASSPRLPTTASGGFESLGAAGGRLGGQGRPSSEYIGSGGGMFRREEGGTPEPEAIDSWFSDLTQYETTLEAMATASLDQNFTDELGAIEQWFRVLNEHERTAALYSLLQHSTPIQIRFFMTVLQQMSRSDPMTALLSPAVGSSMQAQMESRLRSPMVGSGFPNSPSMNQFLAPESALDGMPGSAGIGSNSAQLAAQRNKMRQNRISAPGTLQPSSAGGYNGSGLGDVIERGTSPGGESVGSNSHLSTGENGAARPKSTDFSGIANVPNDTSGVFARSPRPSAGGSGQQASPALGQHLASPKFDDQMSPMLGNWASMVNTPLIPMFGDNSAAIQAQQAENLQNALRQANWEGAGLGVGAPGGRVVLEDASKFRRTSARQQQAAQGNTAMYGDDGEMMQGSAFQPGRAASPLGNGQFGGGQWARSPVPGDNFNSATGAYGMAGLTGLGMGGIGMGYEGQAGLNGLGMGLGGMGQLLTPGQMMSLNHAQQSATAATFAAASAMGQFGSAGPASTSWRSGDRVSSRPDRGKRSPMLRGSPSPSASAMFSGPGGATGGGGAGAGAGVAGEDDVDESCLRDVPHWLRVLRLHKYTTNFAGHKWQDMVVLNDQQLTDKGVAALGARRKLLKAFANIRNHYKIPHPEGYDPEELLQSGAPVPKDE